MAGIVTNTLKLHRNGAVGFIDWLDPLSLFRVKVELVLEAGQIRAGDTGRFIVRADEALTGFVELEAAIHRRREGGIKYWEIFADNLRKVCLPVWRRVVGFPETTHDKACFSCRFSRVEICKKG
jgi:hypothetical protein